MRRIMIALVVAIALILFLPPSAKANDTNNFIKLSEPKDNFMTTSDKVLISGETSPKSNVVILVNGRKAGKGFSVGAAGIFITHIPISSKENIITVKASFPSGTQETVTRKVYQLEEDSKLPELTSLIQTLRSFLILK